MYDYEELLNRAIAKMPDIETTDARFVIPSPEYFLKARPQFWITLGNIADILNRDIDHLMKYLTRELGTAGKIEGTRAVFQGRFTRAQITDNIHAYVDEYVMCSECERPDTQLVRVERVLILKCSACGAHRPVKKRKVSNVVVRDAIEEGGIYELRIDAVGSKGDGIAKIDKYTVFVPGAAKGDVVKVKIKKISGNLAFSEKV